MLENLKSEKLTFSLIALTVFIGVVYFAAVTLRPKVLEVHDAKIASVTLVWQGGKVYSCDLLLDNGEAVTVTPCKETLKKGNRVKVAKVQARGTDYVIQDFN